MLLAVDLHDDFVCVEGIAISLVLSFQAARVDRSEFYAPQPDRVSTDLERIASRKRRGNY